MTERKKMFQVREWLNKPDNGGNAFINVEVGTSGERLRDVDANFSLADCSRIITLDFCIYGDDDVANALYKIDLVHKTVLGFRRHLRQAIRRAQVFEKKNPLQPGQY